MPVRISAVKTSILLVLLSWVVTFLFWFALPASLVGNESDDYHNYYQPAAQRLLAGQGLTIQDGRPLLRYPPGYPVILTALFFVSRSFSISDSLAIQLFILVCIGLIVTLFFRLASAVFGEKTGLFASLVWIAYPGFLWLTKQPNSELPFLVFFLGGVLAFWKALNLSTKSWFLWLVSGGFIGLSVLVRPAGLGVIGILAIVCWLSPRLNPRRKVVACLTLIVSFVAVVLPWELWVYSKTGQVIPVSTGAAPGIWDGFSFGVAGRDPQFRESMPTAPRQFMDALQERAGLSGDVLKISTAWKVFAKQAALTPGDALQFSLYKAARCWYATDSGRFETFTLLFQIVLLIWIARGIWFAWKSGGSQKEFAVLSGGLGSYFLGAEFFDAFNPPVHDPCDGFVNHAHPAWHSTTKRLTGGIV